MCARRRSHFLLLRQKKVTKEKATPFAGPPRADFSVLLGLGVSRKTRYALCERCAQTVARSQTTKRADAPHPKPCAARRLSRAPNALASFAGLVRSTRFASCSVPVPVPVSVSVSVSVSAPLSVRAEPVEASGARRPFDKLRANGVWRTEAMRSEPCRIASRGWRRGAHGLRGARASALRELTSRLLSERSGQRPRSELGAAPQDRAPQSSPAKGRTATVGSPFFAYFLWRSKESRSPAGARPGSSLTQ
jgi:hypothetical protein